MLRTHIGVNFHYERQTTNLICPITLSKFVERADVIADNYDISQMGGGLNDMSWRHLSAFNAFRGLFSSISMTISIILSDLDIEIDSKRFSINLNVD